MESKLKAISLFSGAGGDTLGMKNANIDVIGYVEYNKDSIETHQVNFPDCKLIGEDITKIPDEDFLKYKDIIDILFGGFPCFVAGTKVLTEEGFKNIEDVTLDNKLMTHTGKFQNIINLQRTNYSGLLYKIQAKYHTSFTTTEKHPFYVREKTRQWNTETNKYDYTYNQPEWKRAQNLTNNDYFGMKINQNRIIPEFNFDRKINQHKTENIQIILNELDMWFLMGYFVGDGWIEETLKKDGRSMNKIRFAINNKDYEYVYRRISTILKITDKKCPSGSKCNKYGCADFVWFNILKKFGKYAHDKLIPELVQDAPKEYIEHFIDGYRTADGCITKNERYSFTTVSYNLAFGLQRLYLKLGHLFSINKVIVPKKTILEGRTVNQRDIYLVRGYLRETKRQCSSFIENDYAWFAPFKMEKIELENEPVFNFEVENDNSYCVENIISHNCQSFSNGGKKDPEDERGFLYKEFVRSVKLIKPKIIIGENVKGLLSRKMKNGNFFIDTIVEEFSDLGYDIKYTLFNLNKYGVPQCRDRVLIYGIRQDLGIDINLNRLEELEPKYNQDILEFSMEDTLEINQEIIDLIPEDKFVSNLNDSTQPIGRPPTNLIKCYENSQLSFRTRSKSVFSAIIDKSDFARTILCSYGRMPRLFVPVKNKLGCFLRPYTIKELQQIQGFPKSYIFKGKYISQVNQIGNAIPPTFIEHVINYIKKILNDPVIFITTN